MTRAKLLLQTVEKVTTGFSTNHSDCLNLWLTARSTTTNNMAWLYLNNRLKQLFHSGICYLGLTTDIHRTLGQLDDMPRCVVCLQGTFGHLNIKLDIFLSFSQGKTWLYLTNCSPWLASLSSPPLCVCARVMRCLLACKYW